MTRTRSRFALSIAAVSMLAAACSGGSDAAPETTTTTTTEAPETTTTSSTTSTTTTEPSGPTTTLPPVIRQPLTGAPLDSADEIVDRPALAVKIDNHPDARRNHSGLAVADIVFEEKVEGSLTRFAAVLHSEDADPIGPIRSGRSQDVDILTSLNRPLFAWSGGNAGVTRLIRDSFLTDLNAGFNPQASAYYRGPGAGPHDLYSDSESLYEFTPDDHPGAPPQQFRYLRDSDEFVGDDAPSFDLNIGSINITWEWNAESASFERSQEGDKHVDKTYGQIDAENVVVLVVDYRPSQIDRRSPEAQTIGDGPVFVFSDGQVTEGRWFRELAIYPLTLTDLDGNPILLTPGQTWVELGEAIPTDDISNPDVDLTIAS